MESTGGEGGKTTNHAVLRLAGSSMKEEVWVCLGNTIVVSFDHILYLAEMVNDCTAKRPQITA